MIGIYKITTPSNYVYIGQSMNIKKRWNDHKWPNKKAVSLISRSVKKHGYKNHSFEMVHELPSDIDKKILSVYESFYMNAYREAGFKVINIADARGSNFGYVPSEKTRKEHSERLKGKPSKLKGRSTQTNESKAKIRAKRLLQTNLNLTARKGAIPWNKGMKGVYKRVSRPVSEESKEKIRKALTGKKLSPESIAKRTATVMARTEKKKDWSEESKRKQSERVKLFHLNKKLNAL